MNIPVKPVALVILDGWGIAPSSAGNAIEIAHKPYFDYLIKNYPNTHLQAAGEAVGLPPNNDGNSEVGHLNLGAGRIVYENVMRINNAITDGSFFHNSAFLDVAKHVTKLKSNLHLIGLIGSGEVHSSLNHLISLLWFCKQNNINNVFIHILTDGRDSPPHEAGTLIRELQSKIDQAQVGKIASIIGRYYGMDRDLHWDRTARAYDCLTIGSEIKFDSPLEAIQKSYENSVTDEFILPISIIGKNQKPLGLISDNDGIIFFNFREDRARQLVKAFVLPEFEKERIFRKGEKIDGRKKRTTFKRIKKINDLYFVTMIEYEKGLPVSNVAFPTTIIPTPLSKVVSENNLRQFHIAETEKYPHVTYFFNGGREDSFEGEDRVIVPSPGVPTYDLKPEMSAAEITDIVLERLNGNYDFMIINYANPDMVAHTGNLKATIKAIETIDICLKRLVNAILKCGGIVLVTSDHGNAEELKNKEGETDTQHSNNEVPLIVIEKSLKNSNLILKQGILADIAPTVLYLMKLNKPSEMSGINLIENN